MHRHFTKLAAWDINLECSKVKERVKVSGLMNLAFHMFQFVDSSLISAFVERWHPETNTFHLPFGEMTITLDDVCQILNVPMTGICLYDYQVEGGAIVNEFNNDIALNLVKDYLGIDLDRSSVHCGCVQIEWLVTNFRGIATDEDDDDYIDEVARAYLLFLLGCEAFSDKSGNRVSVKYLEALKNLDAVNEYAWGMSILAYLYNQLGKASRAKCKQMAGCFTLMETWIHEHFRIGSVQMNLNYDHAYPRMCRYTTTVRMGAGDGLAKVSSYREELDALTGMEVVWDPYGSDRVIQPYAFYNGLLVCYDITEPYYPDRFLRQFGHVQRIPKLPMIRAKSNRPFQHKYSMDEWTQVNWGRHLLPDECRGDLVGEPWETTDDYLNWYSGISYVRIQNPASTFSRPSVSRPSVGIEVEHMADGRRGVELLRSIDQGLRGVHGVEEVQNQVKESIGIFERIFGCLKPRVEGDSHRQRKGRKHKAPKRK